VVRDGRIFIFYEFFDYRSFLGKLHCVEFGNPGNEAHSVETINTSGHASYPFIFEYRGEVFCVPETRSAGKISLYVATEFPYTWTYHRTLVHEFAGVDPSIIEYNGLWYLFFGAGNSGHDLHIWYAEDPLGVWHSHRKNPVRSGCFDTRPAGTLFIDNGVLYRPAQDGTKTYGGGIIIYKVSVLSPEEFREVADTTLVPSSEWLYSDGLHTLSAVGDMTLIDAKRYVFALGGLKHQAMQRWFKESRRLQATLARFVSWVPGPN
jgi:hypothetical protein